MPDGRARLNALRSGQANVSLIACAAVAVMQDLAREISDTAATIPIITRANLYASRPGCILNLEPSMPSGDDRFNDVRIAEGCH